MDDHTGAVRPVPTPGMRAAAAAPDTRRALAEMAQEWAAEQPGAPFPTSPLWVLALCEHADEQADDLRRLRHEHALLQAVVRVAREYTADRGSPTRDRLERVLEALDRATGGRDEHTGGR